MRYVIVTECRIGPGKMQRFTTEVQKWEQDAMSAAGAPVRHAVYLSSDDPARVLVVTEFPSREAATAFSGQIDAFRRMVLSCVDAEPAVDGFDLFYSATPDGAEVVFGEDAAHG